MQSMLVTYNMFTDSLVTQLRKPNRTACNLRTLESINDGAELAEYQREIRQA